APVLPEGTTKLPTAADDPIQYVDRDGNLLGKDGDVVQHAKDAPKEGSPTTPHTDSPVNSPVREPVLAGVGARNGDDVLRLGSDPTGLGDLGRIGDDIPTGQIGDNLPGGHADDLGHTPSNSHEPPTGGHGGDGPGGHNDGPNTHPADGGHNNGGGGGHQDPPHTGDGPGGHGNDGSPTGGDHIPDGPGSDLPGLSHGDDGGVPGGITPDGPRGNLPDGSWAGENGLRLDRDANASADDFMRRSAEAEPRITESMQGIAGKVDNGKLIGLEYRLKGEDSLKRKLATDMLEDVGVDPARALGDIKDSIRYTMEVPSNSYTHGVQQAIDDLQAKGFENVTFKNTWDSAGYKGINSTWRDPISGQTFELQFHTADSFTAKMDGHVLYEKERLPGVSPNELAAIKAEQTELFGKVPVPRGAGDITIGGRSIDDVVSTIGKDIDSAVHGVGSTADDVGRLGDDAAHLGDDAAHVGDDAAHIGDDADNATDGARADDHDGSPYTDGPHGGWSGAGWIEKPDPIHDPDSVVAAEMYENIRSTDNKVELPAISRNTGVDESVLRQVKSHLFRSQHEVAIAPGTFKKGLFTPRIDVGEMWFAAREGKLSEEGLQQFKHLMAHEYVESSLMKSGLPYIREYDHLWELDPADGRYYRPKFPQDIRDAGAHDFAPNDKIGGFRHWRSLGMEPPKVQLADDLSNVDDVVKAIRQEMHLKGFDLK
ncbi:hypothetical protein ACFC07_40985, partial [Streptomyces sp. NPDC056099]|uniref:hypothetical protein n=2 Tax=Streptomyces TaxID=1883 RepID=UPI0035D6C1D9